MIRLAIPLLILAAGGAATAAIQENRKPDAATARVERTLAGLTPGKPRNCIPRNRISELRTADGVILYVSGRNRVYRNDVLGQCAGLRRDDMVVSFSAISGDYCRGDIIRTRARTGGMMTGSCALGTFVPYTK
ncbi:hypothetical protein [Sphingomonas hengshuiensis]|uniref:Nuclease n=1 Tax=Sphingomonas hengshuiensis TaxID=1609977 RepID=A0A7U5BEN5_9SPHN|nr:hypothetical protein [Sphingomonas hengshuiensis]AJP70869.1 hypothetical protein TS85_02110 [Sphingomonas hengshuiensis]